MRTVVLNGMRESGGAAEAVLEILSAELEKAGCEVEIRTLREMEIGSCHGCFGCWTKSPGCCLIDDQGREVAEEVIRAGLAVFLSPVTFGGYSSELKKVVDRLIPLIAPLFLRAEEETDMPHSPRGFPRLLGLGWMDGADEEGAHLFKTLVERNATLFHSPSHAAAVALTGEGKEELGGKIRHLLAEVGVKP